MELSILLVKQIGSLFLIILSGYVAQKCNIVKFEDSRALSMLSLYLIFPCVIIDSYQIEYSREKMLGLVLAIVASAGVHFVYIVLSHVVKKTVHINSIEEASLIYSNAGNLIIPLVAYVLGPEWVFYCSAYLAVQTVFIWTHGKSIIREAREFNLKQLLLNTNIIATILGMIMFISGISLPSVLANAVSAVGSMVGPISMIITGIIIANMDLIKVFKNIRAYTVSAARLLIYPLIIVLLCCFSGMLSWHPQAEKILLIVILASAAPTASMVTQLAQVYDKDAYNASVINVVSIIFCIITMPVIVYIYQVLSG
ncbi:MAG TPA: AEC family transporter [Syntrophomonadaceae bacterium]|nr:AEC family transporter [Syntrophomonadaceae bacterium]